MFYKIIKIKNYFILLPDNKDYFLFSYTFFLNKILTLY